LRKTKHCYTGSECGDIDEHSVLGQRSSFRHRHRKLTLLWSRSLSRSLLLLSLRPTPTHTCTQQDGGLCNQKGHIYAV